MLRCKTALKIYCKGLLNTFSWRSCAAALDVDNISMPVFLPHLKCVFFFVFVSGVAERLILRTISCYLWAGYIRIQLTSGIWLTNPLCALQKPLLSCLDCVWSLGRQNNWSAWEHQKVEKETIAHRPLRRSLPSPNLVSPLLRSLCGGERHMDPNKFFSC